VGGRRPDRTHARPWQTPAMHTLLPLLLACTAGSGSTEPALDTGSATPLSIPLEGGQVVVDPGGFLNLWGDDGAIVVQHAIALVMLDAADDSGLPVRTDADRVRRLVPEVDPEDPQTLSGVSVQVSGQDGEPDLNWHIYRAQDGTLGLQIQVDNQGSNTVTVAKLVALRADGRDGGGLFLGPDPSTHRILENGSYAALDFVVQIHPGDTEPDAAANAIAPGDFAGHSVSDWDHGVADLDSDAVWVAGATSFQHVFPVINLSYEASHAEIDDLGRTSFSYLSLEGDLLPDPKALGVGEQLDSETFVALPFESDLLSGMEHYADILADSLGVTPWQRRKSGRRVPNGWNSWSGSGGTGGYGTDIDEDLILENAQVMADQLRDWGIDWFQIDDGYEPAYGDWSWDKTRFPHGAAWLSDQIRKLGMRPGLWMAPFSASEDSALYAAHPDWFADKTALGRIIVGTDQILDLSNPEVQDWLRELGQTVHDDWGFEWYKLDFGYQSLFGQDFWEANATREEAWREGLAAMREGLGEDTFLVVVGVTGIDYDLTDSARITLDNAPVWEWDPTVHDDDLMSQAGFKPTVRTAGRRWYLQDRVWINHPDLIFFRSNTGDESWPRLTFEESRSFATFVGLSGGIVKLGDRLVDLDGDAINVIRRLIPTYGVAARPLDLLRREFPEQWHLRVDDPLDGFDQDAEIIGVFDWGRNWDLTENPAVEIADPAATRTHQVDLSAAGLSGPWLAYEFWTGTFLGTVDDTLSIDVPSHDCRVVALRHPTGQPQWLGWNRQISMGGVLLEEARFDATTGTLHIQTPIVAGTDLAPFEWDLAVYVPDTFTLSSVDLSADSAPLPDLQTAQDGAVLHLRFSPKTAGELGLDLHFSSD